MDAGIQVKGLHWGTNSKSGWKREWRNANVAVWMCTCGCRGARGRRRLYFHGAQGRRHRRYREAIPAHALGSRPSRAAPAREPRKGRKGQRRGRRGGARPEVEVVEPSAGLANWCGRRGCERR